MLISGVCVRKQLIFPYVIFVTIIYIYIYVFAFVERPCAVSGESKSPTSDSRRIVREQPGFGYQSDSPGVARLWIALEKPASDGSRIVRDLRKALYMNKTLVKNTHIRSPTTMMSYAVARVIITQT